MILITVKPAVPGSLVRDPVRKDYIEQLGRQVEKSEYWARRLRDNDVIQIGGPVDGGEVHPAIAQWGAITGNIQDQADLVEALSFNYFLQPKLAPDATLTASRSVAFMVAPHGMTITKVFAYVATPSVAGSVVIDLNVNGVSILDADRVSIHQNDSSTEESGSFASVQLPTVAAGATITVDIDSPGLNAAGLMVVIAGHRVDVIKTGSRPLNITPPEISGEPAVGEIVYAGGDAWANSPWGFDDEWLINGQTRSWTTGQSLLLTPADAGGQLAIRRRGANVNGQSSVISVSRLIATPEPVNVTPPSIPLTIANGFQVSGSGDSWLYSPNVFYYQWQVKLGLIWVNIDGKVANRATFTEADVGSTVRLGMKAKNATGVTPDFIYSNEVTISLSRFSMAWPPPVKPLSAYADPTLPLVGTNRTFNVGPGQEHTELNTVPFRSLTAGDVVNIFYRPTPYKTKFAITGEGTEANRIIIHGVMTSDGLRPILSGDGATTADDCLSLDGTTERYFSAMYTENLGLVFIHRRFVAGVPIKPKWIRIENLEIRDTYTASGFTDQFGNTKYFGEGAGGIYAVVVENLEIENNEIHNNSNGVFTNTKDDDENFASYFIYLRRNKIYGNGEVGSTYIHNVYSQAVRVLYEGNYIGQLRSGAIGSTAKDRSSATVVRYNTLVAASRAFDFVDTEGGATSVAIDPLYPYAWMYGNRIINDWKADPTKQSSAAMIHWSSDHTTPRNGTLFFYQNTLVVRADTSDFYHIGMFDCSTAQSRVEASGNIMVRYGDCSFNLGSAGVVIEFKGTNLISSGWTAINGAGASTVTQSGTLLETADPLLTADHLIVEGSPALNKGLVSYSFFPAPAAVANLQVDYQPDGMGSLKPRTMLGADYDLGCFEASTGEPAGSSGGGTATEPDSSGIFNFLTDGALLSATNPKWSPGASTYVCSGGYLRLADGMAYHGAVARFVDTSMGADQSITVVRKGQAWDNTTGGTLYFMLQDDGAGNNYVMWVGKAAMQLRKSGGGSLSYATPTIDWTADTTIKVSVVGGVIKLFINGTEIVGAGYTDSTPLTGGYPGFQIGDNGSVTAHYFDTLTFNP